MEVWALYKKLWLVVVLIQNRVGNPTSRLQRRPHEPEPYLHLPTIIDSRCPLPKQKTKQKSAKKRCLLQSPPSQYHLDEILIMALDLTCQLRTRVLSRITLKKSVTQTHMTVHRDRVTNQIAVNRRGVSFQLELTSCTLLSSLLARFLFW